MMTRRQIFLSAAIGIWHRNQLQRVLSDYVQNHPPHYEAGWVYWINWLQIQSATLQLPFISEVSEKNLSSVDNQ